jgi:hypothetical protein
MNNYNMYTLFLHLEYRINVYVNLFIYLMK